MSTERYSPVTKRSSRLPRLVEHLLDPARYPHPADRVELVETHISWVLLAGDRVYKIKKPVNLGFLDFTTLALRRRFCQDEVRLNRRLTSDIYLGVVEIKGSAEAPRFEGRGPTLEVAVVMRRLPAERMLDRLVRENAAPAALLDGIGTMVARFHAAADTGGEIDELGGIEAIRQNWQENFAQTDSVGPELLPDDTRRRVREYVGVYLEREAPRFAARVAAGRSRDCHGDLQAQHVCCVEPVQIFDCIEFNHRFRFGDVAGEIAFLAMDLERLGRADLAIRFLNAYLEENGDYEAVPLLDFYRAYRAWVRAKVTAFQVGAHPERAGEARALFELAARFAAPHRRPRLIITSGVMGTGKSTAARHAAGQLGAIVVRTDAVRKRLGGVPLRERVASAFGAGLYAPEMGRRTYAETVRLADGLLRAGWPVILDGSFSHAAERAEARAMADRHGVPFAILWCDAPDEILVKRLRGRSEDRHEVSDGREALLTEHRARYESPAHEPRVVRLDTGGEMEGAVERAVIDIVGN
jgi:aminoglycoside phosphotransferase family enzyme/predicted kinase